MLIFTNCWPHSNCLFFECLSLTLMIVMQYFCWCININWVLLVSCEVCWRLTKYMTTIERFFRFKNIIYHNCISEKRLDKAVASKSFFINYSKSVSTGSYLKDIFTHRLKTVLLNINMYLLSLSLYLKHFYL